MIGTEDREISLFDILNARSCEFKRVKRPSVRIGGRISASGYRHHIVLVVYVVVFKFDRVRVDNFFLIDDDLLTILVVIDEAYGVVELITVGDYSIRVHRSERR